MPHSRLSSLRSTFASLNIDAFLVTNFPHIRYISGFSGSNGVAVVTNRGNFIVTDGRYAEQIKREATGWTIGIANDYDLYALIKRKNIFRPGMRVGFDGNTVTLAQYRSLKKTFPKLLFRPRADVMEKIAISKDEHEIRLLKEAISITDKVFTDILSVVKPGVAEADIAAELTYRHRKYGADGDAFEPIVASGTMGALPHARASSKKIKKGEMVTLDFGCIVQGYHSDLTRTVAVGKPSKEMQTIYGIVLEAQLRAIEAAHSGMTAFALDAVARDLIKKYGYGKYFQHSLGHGLGLQIHEPPKVSFTNKSILPERCVVTIEPGIYVANLGGVRIGDGAPISVQSMTKTDTRDVRATLAQIRRLEKAGCEIIRLAIPDAAAAAALARIKARTRIPLVADIHFDHRLALACLDGGVDGLRINPGNIGGRKTVAEGVKAARRRAVPIRIGVNSGSLERDLLARHGEATAEAMAESALRHIRILEDLDFRLIKVSLKASDVGRTVEAYRRLAEACEYPFHAGITEAGGLLDGSVKSAVGLGLLISRGLADTIRVSLTAAPELEVRVAWRILASLGLRRRGVEIVSCPTCGRSETALARTAAAVEKALAGLDRPIPVAVMGCMVNGPGEAREADFGVACGRDSGIIFRAGRILGKVPEAEIAPALLRIIGGGKI